MSFQSSDLSVLAYANNFTLWHFATTDADISTPNYFDKASSMLRANDLLIANIDTDGTPVTKFYVVTGNDGSTVSVSAYV